MTDHEALEACTLSECPPGLFMFNGIMGFKSEYTTTLENPRRYQCDAYVVESGEYFWGGAKNTQERAALIVTPLRTGQLIPAPSVDNAADKIMWHVEQVMGPVSREVCENPGDDDYSVLRHNIAACLKAKEQADG